MSVLTEFPATYSPLPLRHAGIAGLGMYVPEQAVALLMVGVLGAATGIRPAGAQGARVSARGVTKAAAVTEEPRLRRPPVSRPDPTPPTRRIASDGVWHGSSLAWTGLARRWRRWRRRPV